MNKRVDYNEVKAALEKISFLFEQEHNVDMSDIEQLILNLHAERDEYLLLLLNIGQEIKYEIMGNTGTDNKT